MDEEDIKTILEEPLPSKGPAKKNKNKRKKKKVPVNEIDESPTNESPTNESPSPPEEAQQPPQQRSIDEISIPISLTFLVFIRNLLNNIVPRTKWRPEEMAPVGMAISELSTLIELTTQSPEPDQTNNEQEQANNEQEQANNEPDVSNESNESEQIDEPN
jgi:hypothetical protein